MPDLLRLLILDDDPAIGRTIEIMAQMSGAQTLAVSNADEFFRAVTEWGATHIILDLIMPGMDGMEVLQRLARQRCRACLAISSGVGSRVLNAAQRSAQEHGLRISCVLPKPFEMAALNEFLSTKLETDPVQDRLPKQAQEAVTQGDLNDAIAGRQFYMVYQPKIDCRSLRLQGFEALIRWRHPSKGLIMPDRFIPLAENLGLIGLITDQVVDLSLTWLSQFNGNSDVSVSINISAKTLGNAEFPDDLEVMCRHTGATPQQVILEITETAAMDDQLLALDMFTRLRMKGFNVSIDDFGIGNSSLALLARLPFSEIKVDRSFAMVARQSKDARAIIKSTVDLSHSLDLRVVTEGVEDVETLDFLREIGCDYAQGYYIARPIDGDKVTDWMHQHGR